MSTKLGDKHEFIDEINTWNSGGNVMLDVIKLKSGKMLIISDEVVCKYDSMEEWMGDEGEYNYNKYCVDLIETYKDCPVFEFEGVEITEPTMSECGRFRVNPYDYYGEAFKQAWKDRPNV